MRLANRIQAKDARIRTFEMMGKFFFYRISNNLNTSGLRALILTAFCMLYRLASEASTELIQSAFSSKFRKLLPGV